MFGSSLPVRIRSKQLVLIVNHILLISSILLSASTLRLRNPSSLRDGPIDVSASVACRVCFQPL